MVIILKGLSANKYVIRVGFFSAAMFWGNNEHRTYTIVGHTITKKVQYNHVEILQDVL